MRVKYFIALLFISLCLPVGLAAREIPHPEGIVTYCFDGDTFKLRDRRIVRLAGIDAPETAHQDQPAQYYSRQSKQLLESLVRGKSVQLLFPGVNQKDRHGRLIAEVILPDGQSLNELMISAGAAFFYPHQDLGPEFQNKLRQLQAEAILERRGMWAHLLDLPLANKPYIGNQASLRFFPENCLQGRRIKPSNREDFKNLMDAFMAGYAPARVCIFWPDEKPQP